MQESKGKERILPVKKKDNEQRMDVVEERLKRNGRLGGHWIFMRGSMDRVCLCRKFVNAMCGSLCLGRAAARAVRKV
jgi:hypothetical protein